MSVKRAFCWMVIATLGTAPLAAQEGPLPFDSVPADAASPFGGMAITPTRVVLDNGGAGEQVTLYNNGNAPVTYRIDAVDLGLDAAGDYVALTEGAEAPWSALPFVRYSPRQVTLHPGQRQSVRIIARAPRDMAAGEYRGHLSFSTIPLVDKPISQTAKAHVAEQQTVSVSVALDYRITIPILLRTGRPEGGSAIEAATPEVTADGRTQLRISLRRTGQRSDYGTLRAYDSDGKEVGTVAGVSVLPPTDTRIVPMPIEQNARPVRLVYEEELPGRKAGQILAERVLR